jgi:hypothetical protein
MRKHALREGGRVLSAQLIAAFQHRNDSSVAVHVGKVDQLFSDPLEIFFDLFAL